MTRWILTAGLATLLLTGCSREDREPTDLDSARLAPTVPQGSADGCNDLPVADEFERVDRYAPTFSNPTNITNPLFPVGTLDRAVRLGYEDGQDVRIETARLKATRTITLDDGQRVRAVQTRTMEWRDGELSEVTTDWYAQDDIGAVWYLGEDVARYEDGHIVDTEGSWLAGKDGPPGMIMPGYPSLGDAWRPENICGVVFEEVTLLEERMTIEGPGGTIVDAVRVRELHMDGTTEEKIIAPGYGEFSEGLDPDIVAIAVSTPTDGLQGRTPDAIQSLYRYAEFLVNLAPLRQWAAMATQVSKMRSLFDTYQATGIPPALEAEMYDAIEALDVAIAGGDLAGTQQAAIDIEMLLLDLRLPYENGWLIDVLRLKVWDQQLRLDRQSGDSSAVASDLATIAWIKKQLA